MGKHITREEYKNRVLEELKEKVRNEQGDYDRERLDECISEHLEDQLDNDYPWYKSEMNWNQCKENMTFEDFTDASVNASANCLSMFY
ncbi:MAG: hypothetical protein PUF10_02755 [Bacteroidales bacterium]|nr:hypothetical protein [Bacteroidales bacterium]